MINVNVLCLDETRDQVNVYTHFPYTPNSCDRIEPSLLMSISNETISLDNDFFPNKLKNFHQCPLWLATYNIPPYMILNKGNDSSYVTRGIEGNLYRELSKLLNFQPLIRVGHERYLGGAKENFEMLRKGEVNLTMFAIVNTIERSKRFTSSFPYAYTSVVFTTPHGPPYTPLEKLLLPFDSPVWACILIVTVATLIVTIYVNGCCSTVWQDFVFGNQNQTPFLNFINITLGGVVTQAPVRNFARTIFLIWLLGSLILRSSYQGALFSFIQSQKSAVEIESLDKLAEFNFTIYSSVQILRLLQLGSPHLSGQLVFIIFYFTVNIYFVILFQSKLTQRFFLGEKKIYNSSKYIYWFSFFIQTKTS